MNLREVYHEEKSTMNNTPLNDLARRINDHEAKLQRLRREFEERQRKLASLTRRKAALLSQLRQIEAETAALVTGKTIIWRPKTTKRAKGQQATKVQSTIVKVAVPSGKSGAAAGLTLAHLIVRAVREAHGPLSVSQIAKESLRRGFTSTSSNFQKMVAIRVHELSRKGMLRPADDQSGFVLGRSALAPTASAHKPVFSKGNSRNGTPVGRNHSKLSKGKRKNERTSLRSVLTTLLQRSKGPLLVRDLAKKALAAGYHSTSKDFENVVQVTVGRMEDLVNVRGKGYSLKKRKA
jgi:hypothetical protein